MGWILTPIVLAIMFIYEDAIISRLTKGEIFAILIIVACVAALFIGASISIGNENSRLSKRVEYLEEEIEEKDTRIVELEEELEDGDSECFHEDDF